MARTGILRGSELPHGACCAVPVPVLATAMLTIENMGSGTCLAAIERSLTGIDGVAGARASLSARRVRVAYEYGRTSPAKLIEALSQAGYRAAEMAEPPADPARAADHDLLKRMGVAGFAAANIMLMSVAVWAGLASDMGPGLQALFHWTSALIAMPAIVIAGDPFFRSAVSAIRARHLNMDVPISVAITLATAMSLFQTMRGSSDVYFDAAVTLLFFLLAGRFLDTKVRTKALGAAQNLLALKATRASVIREDGTIVDEMASALRPGARVLVAAGERVPADGVLAAAAACLDESLITGETLPRAARTGEAVHAGTVNLGSAIEIQVTAADEGTLIAEIARLMSAAEQGRGRYVRLADRAARLYAPMVHLLGLSTLLGWLALGHGWEAGLTAAIAVLIITCPCALALAVPAVQVAAAHRLFRQGILVKAPDGLERLAEVDTIVLDKTGTLTLGRPVPAGLGAVAPDALRRAASLAAASRHPYSRALAAGATELLGPVAVAGGVEEVAGAGLRRPVEGGEELLGSAGFAGSGSGDDAAVLWFSAPGLAPVSFTFRDDLRSDAADTVAALREAGFDVELLSGDGEARVAAAAGAAGIVTWRGARRPGDKIARLEELKRAGRRVLMIGDGLNDAPALAAGHASLSPSTAADISQTASDAVFQGDRLRPVLEILGVARMQRRMALQNFAIALLYNVVSVPLAMAGHVTPLVAAIAMSTSSILVTANALRLGQIACRAKARRP